MLLKFGFQDFLGDSSYLRRLLFGLNKIFVILISFVVQFYIGLFPPFPDTFYQRCYSRYPQPLNRNNPSIMKLEIDIMVQNVVCDGKARLTELPVHGETKIVTHQGKVKRVKFDEGEGCFERNNFK
jgi:hypothetical protein